MNRQSTDIRRLSGHLQRNLSALRGKLREPPPNFTPALLIPVAGIVAAVAFFSLSKKARNSLLLQLTMLVSTHLLQHGTDREDEDHESSER